MNTCLPRGSVFSFYFLSSTLLLFGERVQGAGICWVSGTKGISEVGEWAGQFACLETDGYVAESDCLLLNETRNRLLIGPGLTAAGNKGSYALIRAESFAFLASSWPGTSCTKKTPGRQLRSSGCCIQGLDVIGVSCNLERNWWNDARTECSS